MNRPHRWWLHLLLLALTLVTCASAGARLTRNFLADRPAVDLNRDFWHLFVPSLSPEVIWQGLPFALCLVGILLAHEMGHYWACRHYGLDASLPYFLPAPPFIGTFGAFIRIRSVIYSRRVLFDVGFAGPLAGFVALIPVLLTGLAMSKRIPGIALEGDMLFGTPLLMGLLERLYFPGVPEADIYLHPIARAAWIGLFATALNLLPIGQLDGGHLIYALFGERHRTVSLAALLALIPLGSMYPAWWAWAVLLYWLGRRHPFLYDRESIGRGRQWGAAAAAGIFLLSFMPAPILSS